MSDLRTTNASTAASVASALNLPLKKMRLAPGSYVPELLPPDEPSTGGGVRALQRLRLVPEEKGHPTLVIGAVNMKSKSAELRSFLYLDTTHRKRFNKAVPLSREEYVKLLGELELLLDALDVKTTVSDTPSFEDAAALPIAPTSGRRVVYLLLVALIAVAAVVFWLRRAG
jgi:hypothetical protein